jgi:voltage-gated sodium channel
VKKLVQNEKFILTLILVNVGILYIHTFDVLNPYFLLLEIIDISFTLFFCLEIFLKIRSINGANKLSKYLRSNWNKIDFFSVLFSLPSIAAIFFNQLEVFTLFVALRSLRIFKLLRIIEFIPNGKTITGQMFKAFKSVSFIIFAFTVYSTIVSLISVSLFKHYSPTYFNNAFDSFFTVFKVFSGDGFSDVVADIELNSGKGDGFIYFTKFYFVLIVFTGSILGLSLINSIFIDQMARTNDKKDSEEKEDYKRLKAEIDELKTLNKEILHKLNEINSNNKLQP